MTSIKRQLIVWLVGLLAAVALLAGGIAYLLGRASANEFLDHELSRIARSVHTGSQLPSMQAEFLEQSEEEQENEFVIQVWNANIPPRSSRPNFKLPKGTSTGYSDASFQGEEWRVYTLIYPDRTVQVSQLHEVRREIATNAALCALLPIAGLFPLSCILVAIGVGRILKPLSDVTRAVTQRDVSSLTPLPGECIPHEVAPLIAEMNSLLLRVRVGIESQRHFVLDAAHELRTPLTALRLQIENLSQSRSKEDLHMRIVELKSGMQRAAHLVEQLLKMARYEAQSPSKKDRVELGEIVKICLGDFIPIAEQRGIDLGIVRFETAFIRANADELRVLLDNLLDNAIRYTPTGGQVDVSVIVSAQKAIVTITDNGRGIPDDLLQRVFDRFFRAGGLETEGSGIGLAIVKTIAQRESAEITLCNRSDGHGLIASVALDIFAAA